MTDENIPPAFPCGLTVFLRSSRPNGDVHQVVFPLGRNVVHENPTDIWYQIYDEKNEVIGIFHTDTISFILPLPSEAS